MYFYLYDNETLLTSTSPFVTDKHKELTRDEYDEIAISRGMEPYKSEQEIMTEQMAQEQAELLKWKAETTDENDLNYINTRLADISDYWDSLEPVEVLYGTN